mmetsp:Transcript_10888/g.18538  ORF Transcript_10888/g.18538 Transcript_10888/m.18538 type:complete len:93 (+) Transcript_10888:1226-1504(+)
MSEDTSCASKRPNVGAMIGNILSNSLFMFSESKISAQRKRLAPSYYTCVGGLIVATTEFLQIDCVQPPQLNCPSIPFGDLPLMSWSERTPTT